MSDATDPPPPPNARAVGAAAIGAITGAVASMWLTESTSIPPGLGALLGGGLAGYFSRRQGGKGAKVAAAAALLALVGAFFGFGFAARAKVEAGVRNEIASLDRAHYDSFAAAAADWRSNYTGDETAKFAKRHEFVQFGSGVEARLAEFRRTVVPKLEAWKKSPPTFAAWRESRTAEINAVLSSPMKAYFASPLDFISPLDFLFALVAVGGAGWIANVPEPVKIVRKARRESGPEPSTPG